jgi:hypothetical protein
MRKLRRTRADADRRNIGIVITLGFFARWLGVQLSSRCLLRLEDGGAGLVPDSIIGAQSHALDSPHSPSIRGERGRIWCRSRLLRRPRLSRCCQKARSKNNLYFNALLKSFDHGPVLFVQHPLEKARNRGVGSGSFIACAEVLGNCDHATEGGIPRSSR